ncbi:MAG: TlpA family protein disulfide reductase, partial [bacterium]|nr:TlpA family protein disulfide reductase [bacterium]
VPWLKRLAATVGDRAVLSAVHTAYGHRLLPRDQVAPQVAHYAAVFAELPFPLALDLDGSWAEAMGAEGTPHWFVWDGAGSLERSVYGSQENALTRLGYVVAGWGADPDA